MLGEQIVNGNRLARSLSARAGLPALLAAALFAYGLCSAGLHQLESQRLWVLPAVLLALLAAVWLRRQAQPSGLPFLLLTLLLIQGLASPALEVSLPMAWLLATPFLFLMVLPRPLPEEGLRGLPWLLLVPALLWTVPTLIHYGWRAMPAPETRDPNVVGDVWALALIFAAHQGVGPGARRGAVILLALAAAVVSLVLFAVLGARIAGVLAAVGVLLLAALRRDRRLAWVLLAYGLGWLLAGPFSEIVLARPAEGLGSGFAQAGHRAMLLASAFAMFQEAPLFGGGLMTFGLRQGAAAAALGLPGRAPMVHNDLAQWFAELGLVGAGALALFLLPGLGAALRVLARGARAPLPAADLTLPWALGLGLVLGHSLVNFPLYDPGLWLFVVLARGVLAPLSAAPAGSPAFRGLRRALPLLWLPAFGALVLLSAVALLQGPAAQRLGPGAVFQGAVRISTLAPFLAEPWALQARAAAQQWYAGGRAPALEAYIASSFAAARERGPLYPLYYAEEAEFLAALGQRVEAEAVLAAGFAVDPASPRLWAARLAVAPEDEKEGVARAWVPHCVYGWQRWPAMARRLAEALPPPGASTDGSALAACRGPG
jgi:O-antigen ligase